ncbi:hypothetical protein B0H63DRAFT_468821 [Podospora didyma]|uniref:Uncharacterized protein n=1 Tax=Podospora didyma TaxID=330526 RepID=A0AAE0NSP7_9PEZI|nr:hypothetical protein B0H63DRAFT_468821 [Podospora didyma]
MSIKKSLAIAAVVGFGIFNGIYTFQPSFEEIKARREGTHLDLNQNSKSQQPGAATEADSEGGPESQQSKKEDE